MAMKLTTYQQEMLDGKHGDAKKFGMEKLVDFGEAVEAKEMVDLVLVLNCCPIYSKDRQKPETKKKLEMYDLGHGPLYDPIFAMKDAHVADETGTQAGTIRTWCSSIRSKRRATPGTSSFRARAASRSTRKWLPTSRRAATSWRSMAG